MTDSSEKGAYLAPPGHGRRTVEAAVGRLCRPHLPESQQPRLPST